MVLSATADNQASNNVNIATEIFARYGDFIRGVIRCKTRDRSSVDDLFQNFFLSLVYRPPAPNARNIKSYLYRAILNDIIDNRRRVERYQNHIRGYAGFINDSAIEDSPENALIETEEMAKMFKCIEKQLERSEAQAIILRYRNNRKIKEIAATMGINNIKAWRHVSRGLNKIRGFLEEKHL